MKNLFLKIMVLANFLGFLGCKPSDNPSEWSSNQVDKWFEKGEWLNGWQATPDASVNRKEFAIAYFRNKEKWDKAFTWLKDNKLQELEIRRHDIEGDMLYASVMEYNSKNEADARYESHKKYIDIQYVLSGKELMGISPISDLKEILQPYNDSTDIQFFTVNNITNYKAEPGRFFLFFPGDAHRPGLKDGENSPVKKLVVKVKVE
jgi:YhcH/YjgK/YiaL family protein